MTEPLREALAHAWQTLQTCRPEQRDGIKAWIDSLLDRVNR